MRLDEVTVQSLTDEQLMEAVLEHSQSAGGSDADWGVKYKILRNERHRRHQRDVVEPRKRGDVKRPEWCICHDGYWLRGREDPQCRHDVIEELHEEIERLKKDLRLIHRPKNWRHQARKRLIERDGLVCFYCEKALTTTGRGLRTLPHNFATIDHKVPVSKGGTHALDNLVLACPPCNEKKASSAHYRKGEPM